MELDWLSIATFRESYNQVIQRLQVTQRGLILTAHNYPVAIVLPYEAAIARIIRDDMKIEKEV